MASSSTNSRSGGLLKVIFLLHLILSAWGMQSTFAQIPTSYAYYNLIYMITLLWAIASDGVDSIIMAFLINVIIIVLDALTLSLYWPPWGPRRERLYFGFAIANAVLRPVTAILLYRIFRDRDTEGLGLRGAFSDILGDDRSSGDSAANRQGYENLDTQAPGSNSALSQQHTAQPLSSTARGVTPQTQGRSSASPASSSYQVET